MRIIKLLLGMTVLILVGLILAACASSSDTEPVDKEPQVSSTEKMIFVGPVLVDCQGEGPQKCMLVKENPEDEYSLFYDRIEGFDYEEGYEYRIVVKEEQVDDPPAGGSSLIWTLVRIEDKVSVPIAEEAVEKTIYVGPKLVDCVGVTPQKCMLVKENPEDEYTLFYDQIEGFEYEEGFEYKLVIKEEQVENPPADASSIKWTLVSVESKEPIAKSDVVQLVGADWVLNSYLNQEGELIEPLPGTTSTARLEDGQVNGNAGCNGYFGGYQVEGFNLSIGPLASTEKFCGSPEGVMDQESAFLSAMSSASTYKIEAEQLFISNEKEETILVFDLAEPKRLPGTLWNVIMYNNGQEAVVSVIIGTEITAFFSEDGQISGSAGCNNYSATYEIDGEKITFGPAIATRMACSKPEGIMEQETVYLAALGMATSYRFENDRLILLDDESRRIVDYQSARTFNLSETIWYLQDYDNGSETMLSVLEGSEITAYFDEDGNLSGSAGCNNYTGEYQVDGDIIEFRLGPLTMMFCDQPEGVMDQETAYLKALESVTSYRILGNILVMQDSNGQEVLRFKASDLIGYVWMWLEFLENNDTITQPDMPGNFTLEFFLDGVVNLRADCNNASGTYTVKGSQLDIEIMVSTLAVCPPESLSEEYIQLLNDSVAYIRQGELLFIDIMMDAGTMKFFPQ